MGSVEERIKELEHLIATCQYNKRTQKAIGLYKAQLAKLKAKQEARSGKSGKGEGYQVRKTGDGTVILLGFPSVGKSTLLNQLTGANSEVGEYAFTTLTVVPGVLRFNHAKIQVLDVPGIVKGAASGKGRGREVLACMRSADLCLILLDAHHPEHLSVIKKEVFETNIRLDQTRPDVKIKKKTRGGISIGTTVKLSRIDPDTIEAILKEFRINNADVVIREDIDADQLIDVIEGNRVYMPSLVVLNKIDELSKKELEAVKRKVHPDICISAKNNEHVEELKALIFEKLGLISVFLKEPGKAADMEEPLIMFRGASVRDVCEKLHKDFVKNFKFARVWGRSAKFGGQKVMLGHCLENGDVLELHIR
ncbi:GTP-binding protein [Candidatus Woesearchaeota archaeon]|nr:MAG: GTP-binding protein [Candidatus Woesearchaeota archaeon]